MQTSRKTNSSPLFPAPLVYPLKMLPPFVHNRALVTSLNRVFNKELIDGELDFLQGKIIHIMIDDADLEYRFTLGTDRLIAADNTSPPDLVLQGTFYNYLLLASRKEDSDTLFFTRRLRMQGDTELGLYVKNFLDGVDMDTHKFPAFLESVLQKSLPLYERLFSR